MDTSAAFFRRFSRSSSAGSSSAGVVLMARDFFGAETAEEGNNVIGAGEEAGEGSEALRRE